jgi:hypothetical protein
MLFAPLPTTGMLVSVSCDKPVVAKRNSTLQKSTPFLTVEGLVPAVFFSKDFSAPFQTLKSNDSFFTEG